MGLGACGPTDAFGEGGRALAEPTAKVAGTSPRPAKSPGENRALRVGEEVPDFTLTDQTGKPVRLSRFRGQPVFVTFLYTTCPVLTVCPMATAKFSKLAAKLKEKPLGHLLVITVDPQNDTPAVLREFAKTAGADPARWSFLTGDPKVVAEVCARFGIEYQRRGAQVLHTEGVVVIGPDGKVSSIYYGGTWEPEHLLKDMEKARKG